MKRLLAMLFLTCAIPCFANDTMTYDQATARFTQGELPAWWIADVAGLPKRFEAIESGEVKVIARSPGDRPLYLITYGPKEEVPHRANFNSAIGGRKPACYIDKDARKHPVIFFVGPVHGHEVEGLTGLVNLIEIMETGWDLRGKDQSQLRDLARKCRLVILPCGNPDGVARFEPRAAHGMPHDVFQFWGMGTWSDDRIAYWPTSKQQHPRTGPEIGFLGCYFNDIGINPMHDEFFAPMSAEAPAILRVAMEEGPDLAVSLHSHENRPAILRPAYLPLDEQAKVVSLAEVTYTLYNKRNLPHGGHFEPAAENGPVPKPFNLVSALYHASGATSFTFECPHGIDNEKACRVSLDDILDIQLTLYEGMMRYALEYK